MLPVEWGQARMPPLQAPLTEPIQAPPQQAQPKETAEAPLQQAQSMGSWQ
jgi:hypothetical protein